MVEVEEEEVVVEVVEEVEDLEHLLDSSPQSLEALWFLLPYSLKSEKPQSHFGTQYLYLWE